MKFRWGPVRIAPGQNTISIADDNLLPPGPGWITSFKPNLTYVDGTVPRVDVIHLHHAVWLVAGHGDVRPTWAAGEEKTAVREPKGFGWRYRKNDKWLLNHMIHNLTPVRDAGLHHLGDGLHPARRQGRARDARGQDAVARRRWAAAPTRSSTPSRAPGHDGRVTFPDDVPNAYGGGASAQHLDRRPRRHAGGHRGPPAPRRPVDRPQGHARRAHRGGLPLARALLRAGRRGVVGRRR